MFLGSPFAVTESSRELCADVKAALEAARRDLTGLAIDIGGISLLPKLSEQLNGKQPPTLLWRVLAHMGPAAWLRFTEIRAKRCGRELVPANIAELIAATQALVGLRPVLKARFSHTEKVKVSA